MDGQLLHQQSYSSLVFQPDSEKNIEGNEKKGKVKCHMKKPPEWIE